ncbi:MAG: hypothetical protein P9L88_04365 [Candidatus Tantalella remota]|nr:hypothetical protein [Candidatus Tantalella remota]
MDVRKIGVSVLALFMLAAVVAVPAAMAAQKAEASVSQPGFFASTMDPAKASAIKMGAYFFTLGGLLLILVIGCLIAVGIAALLKLIFGAIRLEIFAAKIKIPEILKKGGIALSLSDLIMEIVFFLIIIGTLITALEFYGLATNPLGSMVLSYIPHVIAAVFILIIAIFLAILISGVIALIGGNMRIAQTTALAGIVKYAIIIFAGLVALRELGLNVILGDNSKDIILGGLVLSFAIAFGLGAKEKAGTFLEGIFKK